MPRSQELTSGTGVLHFWPWLLPAISLLHTPHLAFTPLCVLVTVELWCTDIALITFPS